MEFQCKQNSPTLKERLSLDNYSIVNIGIFVLVIVNTLKNKQWTKFWLSNFLIISPGLKGTDPLDHTACPLGNGIDRTHNSSGNRYTTTLEK